MFVAYCYKLKPNKKQVNLMSNWLSMLRSSYNFCLRDRIEAYEQASKPVLGNYSRLDNQGECCPLTCSVSKNATIGIPWKNNGKKRNAYEQQSSNLPILKKERPWYKNIHSTVLQQNLKRLHKAFDNFFQGKGYPKFKNRSKFRSFSYPPGQVKVNNNSIYLPGIGWMTYFNSRPISEGFKIKTVTVRRKADGWYVSLRLEDKTIPDVPKIELNEVKNALAADLGIKKLISLSDDTIIPNPKFFQKYERRKAIRARQASRKKKGSKNRAKAYQYSAKIEQKIVNERNDYHWKIANELCRKAEILIFENLNIKGLLKKCQPKQDENGKYLKNGRNAKKALSRLIADAAWGELKLKIKSVADKLGLHFVEVDPKNSSRQCHKCGYIDKQNRNKERFFCIQCNYLEDSDTQASKNLLNRGLKQLGINLNQLPSVRRKVTPVLRTGFPPQVTGGTAQEISLASADEPSNPNKNEQLLLFDYNLWSANLVIN
ncbi:MAG: transposase [Xenococcaceae cyanobacterium MO_167.B27]|nr:transposase [Xenococcaceae cyanobacterium MO_167.B27]